jgi:hypothetical protein
MYKSLPWFRLYSEIVSDPKVQMLNFADQRNFIMVLALKCNGTVDAEYPNDEFRHRAMAKALGVSIDEAHVICDTLVKAWLIHGDWQPRKWAERQMPSDNSKDRVKRYRNKHKSHSDVTVTASNGHGNGDVTVQNRVDKNILDKNRTMVPTAIKNGNLEEVHRENIIRLKKIIAPTTEKLST